MVRLLFDQNLSYRLVAELSDLFPGSEHVRAVGLARADDDAVWAFARQAGFAIVSKDGDFNNMSFLYGGPSKVVWIRMGNCSTEQALALLRRSASTIIDFVENAEEALLILD